MYVINIMKEKKAVLVLIPDATVKVNFCNNAKFIKANNIYYENKEKDYLV